MLPNDVRFKLMTVIYREKIELMKRTQRYEGIAYVHGTRIGYRTTLIQYVLYTRIYEFTLRKVTRRQQGKALIKMNLVKSL